MWIPARRSRSAVAGPTPGMTVTCIGRSSSCSHPGATTTSPSGLSRSLATLAMNFDVPIPTEAVSPPVTSRTRCRSCSPTRAPSRPRGRAGQRREVDEGLVERERLDQGETSRSAAITARLVSCRRGSGRRGTPRAGTGARLAGRHRRPDAVGPGLVRRRRHDAAASDATDDDRLAAQRGLVALLDRGEEGVEVEVEHRRYVSHGSSMAPQPTGHHPPRRATWRPQPRLPRRGPQPAPDGCGRRRRRDGGAHDDPHRPLSEDLLAVVPVVLGFEPADSIVMLTLGARHTFHARVDLPARPARRRRGGRPAARARSAPPGPGRRAAALHRRRRPGPGGVARFRRGGPRRRGPAWSRRCGSTAAAGSRCWARPVARRAGVPYDVSATRSSSGRVVGPRAPRLAGRPRRHSPTRPGRRRRGRGRCARQPASGDWVAPRLAGGRTRRAAPGRVAARLLVAIAAPRCGTRPGRRCAGVGPRPRPVLGGAGAPAPETSCPTPPRCWRSAPGSPVTGPSPGAPSTAPASRPGPPLAALVADLLAAAVPPADWEGCGPAASAS